MSNDHPEPSPSNPPEQPAPRVEPSAGPSAPPKVEVRAEPIRGASDQGRVYDAPPPPHREPPPNPFTPPPAAAPHSSIQAPMRGWAVACYLIGLADLGVSILFAGLIFTTALWLFRRGDDPEADFHGKESLNLQLNILFWQVVAVPLILCCLVGVPILIASPFVKIGALIYGGYRASRGERWSFPWIYRLVR